MKIIIAGAGKFGKELVRQLSQEKHNIIVIDNRPDVIEEVVNEYDVMGFCGNGASYQTQLDASVKKADLFVATTGTDEANILCCLVAKKLGVKQTIARVRNPEYALQAKIMSEELGVTLTLNPDLDTAREIFRILRFPSAIKVDSFAKGKVDLVEIKLEKDSVMVDKPLIEIREKYQVKILICAVKRGDQVIIPNGYFILQEGDYVYITGETKELTSAFRKLKLFKNRLKSAMIVGGGKITYYLASLLIDNGISVKIIENKKDVCKQLSETLKGALIIHGDATNQKLMLEEGVETVGSLITLTGMDETNIIVSTFAKGLTKNKIITKVNNPNYDVILNSVGLESVVSPKDIFCSHILKHARGMGNNKGSEFKTLYRLVNNKVEALEFAIPKKTKYTSIPIKDLHIKNNYLLACIIRDNRVIIPNGLDTLEPLDSVIIVTTNTSVKDVSDILE